MDLIQALKRGVESPVTTQNYEYMILEASSQIVETVRQVLSELKIEVSVISYAGNVILVGYKEALQSASEIVKSIRDKTGEVSVDEKLEYVFTDIPQDKIAEFSSILSSLRLEVQLLSSPSGVMLVGIEAEAERAMEVIKSVLSKSQEDESVESRYFNNPAGWEEGKLATYLRSYLGERDWVKISITPVQAGYLIVGPSAVLERIQNELSRLAGLEKPYYQIVDAVPSIQNLEFLLEKMGLAVSVVTTDGKTMIIGTQSDVSQAVRVLNELTRGIKTPDPEEKVVYAFIDIPSEEIENFRTIFDRLAISVDLINTPSGPIAFGASEFIELAKETATSILSRKESQIVAGETSYLIVEVRDGFDLASAQSVISAFNLNTYPLSVAGKLVIIGSGVELERFSKIRSDIISEHRVTVIVPREVSLEELSGISQTLQLDVSVFEIRNNFVVYGKEQDITKLRSILNEVVSKEPSVEALQIETFTGIEVDLNYLREILDSMQISMKLYGEGKSIVAVGKASDLTSLRGLLKQLQTDSPEVTRSVAFYPKLEGWTGEILGNFFQAMDINVLVFQENSRGYLLIGLPGDLERIESLLDGLEMKIKTVTKLYQIPSGMSFEELRDILLASGFNLSYNRIGQSMSISGPEDAVSMAIAMLDEVIRSGLGKGLSYTLIDLPADLTLDKLQKIMLDMELTISIVQIEKRFMLIGTDGDLRRAREIVEYLRPEKPVEETEKVYAVVALPEGLTVNEVSLLVERLGINVEVLSVAENIVLIGTNNAIDAFKELIATISGALGTGSRDTVSYRIVSLPSGVTVPQFEALLDSLRISSRIVEVSDSIVFVGTPEENAIAEKLLYEFKPQEVLTQDTSRSYTTISMPPGFDFASLSSILEKIGLDVDLTLAGNVLVVVGDKEELPEVVDVISGLHGTGSRPEIMKLEYDVLEIPLSLDMNTLNEAIGALKIPSTLIRSGNSLLIVGSNADIAETKRLVTILQPRDLSEGSGRSYRIITMPAGFTSQDLQTLLTRTGTDVEVLQVENVLLLAGSEDTLESSIKFIERLRKVSTGDTGDRGYEILSTTEAVGVQLLTQLYRLVGLDVDILDGDGFVVFAGRKSEIVLAVEIFDSLVKKTSKDAGPLSYTITILPQSLTAAQLQEAFESIKIPVSLMEAGDYTIMVGTKDSLTRGQELISSLRIGVDASGTSADGSISYVTFGKPEGTEINQLETIAGLMELKLKFQSVGDKVFMIGSDRDLMSFEEVLKGLAVEKAGVVNQFRYARVIPGLNGDTLNLYLVAKGVELAGVFDVSGGYLLVGNAETIEQAQYAIDYLSDNQRTQFSYVDLPANLAMETLQRMASDLLLNVSFLQITPTRYMLVGASEDVNNLKTVLLEVAGDGTKLANYRIVNIQGFAETDFSLDALETVFNSIGLTVKTVRFGSRLILVGDLRDIEISTALIGELGSSMSEAKGEKLTIAELTRVGGWSIDEIDSYLTAAEISLKAIVEYAGRLIGIGTQSNLEEANRALKFLNDTSVQESVRIDKSLVTFEQLSDMIRKLNLKIEFVELDRQWLLIGDSRSLMIIARTVEEAAADKEISRYVTDLTVDVQELAALLRESIDGVTVQTFENLQMLLLKSKSSALLDMAQAMIKGIQESRKAVDPVEKGVTVNGSMVGINVVDQDLQKLLGVVAEKLEIPILFIDSLEDRITMSVKEISWEGLVSVINATKPVSISKINDLYAVTKKEQKSGQEPTDIELVYRVYHNVAEVTRLIEFYGGQVLSDPVNGYIVVRGLAKSKVDSIFDEIATSLAKPKKQVKIETKLVDKSLLDEMQRSVNTKINTTNPTIILQNGSLSLDFKIFENLDISKVLQGIIDSASAEIKAELKDKNTDSDLISSPSIVSMSGEEATIHIGDTIPYLVKRVEFVEGRPVEVETIEFLNTGVELKITPTVNDDGKILLDLYIKVSEPEKYVDGTRTLYGEKTREATSRLVISDGNTLTIGGLVANKDSVNVNKMPFLSDLPFVGKLFTTQSVTTDRRELVIFITAEVVQP